MSRHVCPHCGKPVEVVSIVKPGVVYGGFVPENELRAAEAHDALDEVARLNQEMGLYDD